MRCTSRDFASELASIDDDGAFLLQANAESLRKCLCKGSPAR